MKITKLVHSCLLVEKNGKRILVDPGNYSWASSLITSEHLNNISSVVITHIHPDHCDEVFVQAILKNSPDATWYSTSEVAHKLEAVVGEVRTTSEDTDIKFINSEHADLSPWFNQQPEHTSFVLFGELLIGGDCHTLTGAHGARIFGGAINGGPWGGVVGFAKMIETMNNRPEIVIPLHDWHFNEDARKGIYERLPEVLKPFNVDFVPLESGVAVDL